MDNFENFPILNLNQPLIEHELKNLKEAIQSSWFISLDIEMSGLGDRTKINNSSIDERYKNLKEVVSNYCILSLGISCFKLESLNENIINISNKTYNLLTLNTDKFMIEPESAKFLVKHDFDFNDLFINGIKYYKGNDRLQQKSLIRDLFMILVMSNKPIVFHNGFIDLVFLYESFYAKLPNDLMTFVADVSDLFKAGLYDTKYIADFCDRSNASYLEYLYNTSLYQNTKLKNTLQKSYLSIRFSFDLNFSLIDYEVNLNELNNEDFSDLCKTYSTYGYCSFMLDQKCNKSHDIDKIIKYDLVKKIDKNKVKKVKSDALTNDVKIKKSNKIKHNAGLDAYMTGYVMLNYINRLSFIEPEKSLNQLKNLDNFVFNVYLTGKDYPLIIKKSNFSKLSQNHLNKKNTLKF